MVQCPAGVGAWEVGRGESRARTGQGVPEVLTEERTLGDLIPERGIRAAVIAVEGMPLEIPREHP